MTTFTHAARYQITDVDAAGLWAFLAEGNHCPCDAVRFAGAVVFQSGGFDGPHELLTYEVVRESDGAKVDVWEESLDGDERTGALVGWYAGDVTDPESAARGVAVALAHPALDHLDARRLRFDPHPAGSCWACA